MKHQTHPQQDTLQTTFACELALTIAFVFLLSPVASAEEKIAATPAAKATTIAADRSEPVARELFARPAIGKQTGHRMLVGDAPAQFPLVVVRGTPYEMGQQLGACMRSEIRAFLPAALAGICAELQVTEDELREVWGRTAAFADDRVEQEMAGLADGCGLPLGTLQAVHAVPLLMPYSCSSIAAWDTATTDGHLYQTRNLDWSLKVKAHEFPCIVLYLPDRGAAHVVPGFAGMIGAHTGMNAKGIALSEMGDASKKEMPYQVHAPHFTVFFRTLLYDADSLSSALAIFKAQPQTKRYHFVFGDGQTEHKAVKIRAHAPEPAEQRLAVWKDNDPSDEFAPNVLSCVVYNDEGRGAFPQLKQQHGKLGPEQLIKLANQIAIHGGNVVNVVYDTTALKLWVSYAKGEQEAYQRPYALVDLRKIDADGDGQADLQ